MTRRVTRASVERSNRVARLAITIPALAVAWFVWVGFLDGLAAGWPLFDTSARIACVIVVAVASFFLLGWTVAGVAWAALADR